MTALLLIGLMVVVAFLTAVLWIEPRVLGGPPPRVSPEREGRIGAGEPEGQADAARKPQSSVESPFRRAA